MDCFNFGCPFRVNETSSCNYCACLACQNRDSHEYTIISNRTLTDKEIVETKAKLDTDYGCNYSGQECKEYSMFEPKVNPKTRTNYAKLHALDEEGLAAFLAIITTGDRSDRARWLKWLKQEASK